MFSWNFIFKTTERASGTLELPDQCFILYETHLFRIGIFTQKDGAGHWGS